MNVTVFGATGVVGRALVPLLAEHELTAVSRTAREEPGTRCWSPTRRAARASRRPWRVRRSSTTSSIRSARATSRSRIARRRRRSRAKRRTQACSRSSTSAGSAPTTPTRRRTCAAGARPGRALASAGVPVTTLRAAMIVGKGSAAFETILGLVKRLPVMVTPSWVSTPTQPIALDDVARYLAGVCGNEATYGEGYDTGGPEVMTYRQMIERIAALLGRKPAIVEVPVLTPYLSSLWLNLVTPVERVGRASAYRRTAQSDNRARGADPDSSCRSSSRRSTTLPAGRSPVDGSNSDPQLRPLAATPDQTSRRC